MHAGEVHTDAALVRRLLAAQFPAWANLPIARVLSSGTDHALYRLGDDRLVRLPRIHWAVGQVDKDARWLPQLAPHLPLAIPELLAKGRPGQGYPWEWGIYRWIEGDNATIDSLVDPLQTAVDLARFMVALQQVDIAGGPLAAEAGLRGVPLATRDHATRQAIAALGRVIDAQAATAAWETALAAPDWNRAPVWFHGDMLPGNLLFRQGRLHAVIDFSGLGVGDPAPDLMIAWNLFSGEGRQALRAALGVDDATWARGRGHALSQALIFIPYYLRTNPTGVAAARRAVEEVLADRS